MLDEETIPAPGTGLPYPANRAVKASGPAWEAIPTVTIPNDIFATELRELRLDSRSGMRNRRRKISECLPTNHRCSYPPVSRPSTRNAICSERYAP